MARLRCRVFRECRVFRSGCGKDYIDGKLYKIFAGRVTRQPQFPDEYAHPSPEPGADATPACAWSPTRADSGLVQSVHRRRRRGHPLPVGFSGRTPRPLMLFVGQIRVSRVKRSTSCCRWRAEFQQVTSGVRDEIRSSRTIRSRKSAAGHALPPRELSVPHDKLPDMATWAQFEREAADLAAVVRARFEAAQTHVLATLRKDGS